MGYSRERFHPGRSPAPVSIMLPGVTIRRVSWTAFKEAAAGSFMLAQQQDRLVNLLRLRVRQLRSQRRHATR